MINDQFFLSGKRPRTRLTSLELESNTVAADGFFTSSLTTAERDAIPAANLKRGGFIYNETLNGGTGLFEFYQNVNGVDTWLSMPPGGIGNVVGLPPTVAGDIAIWDNNAATSLVDSGVAIHAVAPPLMSASLLTTEGFIPNVDVNEMSGLGHLKFSDSNGVGLIFLGGLVATHYIEHSAGSIDNICTVITGGSVADGSGSASAILELDSTTGCILHSRATTTQINAFSTPQNGMQVYNTTIGRMVTRESGSWISAYAPGYPTFISDSGFGGNFFIGTNTGNNTLTGGNNWGAGLGVLQNITTANFNVAIMGATGLTTGSKCVSISSGSLLLATSTQRAIAIGYDALAGITTNGWSVGIGVEALLVATGSFNVAVGDQAGRYITLGENNVCVGNLAGPTADNAESSLNTFLGSGTATTSTLVTNSTVIGAYTMVDISNAVILGNGCSVGIGTSHPITGLHLGALGGTGLLPQIYVTSSSMPTTPAAAADGIFSVNNGDPIFTSGTPGKSGILMKAASYGSNLVTSGLSSIIVNSLVVQTNSIIFVSPTLYGSDPALGQPLPSLTSGHIVPGERFTINLDVTSTQNIYANWLIINP